MVVNLEPPSEIVKLAISRAVSYLAVGCKTVVEEIPERVALPHSHMIVDLPVHMKLAEIVPSTVQEVPRNPFEL